MEGLNLSPRSLYIFPEHVTTLYKFGVQGKGISGTGVTVAARWIKPVLLHLSFWMGLQGWHSQPSGMIPEGGRT
jgi:hypothetical protein